MKKKLKRGGFEQPWIAFRSTEAFLTFLVALEKQHFLLNETADKSHETLLPRKNISIGIFNEAVPGSFEWK